MAQVSITRSLNQVPNTENGRVKPDFLKTFNGDGVKSARGKSKNAFSLSELTKRMAEFQSANEVQSSSSSPVSKRGETNKGHSSVQNGVAGLTYTLHSNGIDAVAESTHMVPTVPSSFDESGLKVRRSMRKTASPSKNSGEVKAPPVSPKGNGMSPTESVTSADTNGASLFSDLDIDSMNTLRELESVIDIMSRQTGLCTENTFSDNNSFATDASESGSFKTLPPVPPKRSQRSRKSQKFNQRTNSNEEQASGSHYSQKQENGSSSETVEGHISSTVAGQVNETTPSQANNPKANSNVRRPVSEICWNSTAALSSSTAMDAVSVPSKEKSSSSAGQGRQGVDEKTSALSSDKTSTTNKGLPSSKQPSDQAGSRKSEIPSPSSSQSSRSSQNSTEESMDDQVASELVCYNHPKITPQRYCNDHNQAICLECAFELHRSCRDVEVLEVAARGRQSELEQMCEVLLMVKTEWQCLLTQEENRRFGLAEERIKTQTSIKSVTEAAIKVLQEKEHHLVEEADLLYAKAERESMAREDRVKRELSSLEEVLTQGERVLKSGRQGAILRQFGKIKGRCEEVLDTNVMDSGDILDSVQVTTTWFDDVKLLPQAKLVTETRPAVSKKNMQLSERGLETFRRISRKRRQNLNRDTYGDDSLNLPPFQPGAPSSRMSMARSVASTGSLPSMMSTQSTGFLDGPQSLFEFFAGLEGDKYPFGLGDICVMQPSRTILITYLTSDLLRVFPWRGESSAFTSQSLGCTLCCITQLSSETVAVTSSNSDQLSIMKVESDSINLMHTVSMKRQYRAVTALDYRTLALATDSKKSTHNVIVVVRFDSSDYRSFTQLKTIGARHGSVPMIKFLSKTLFKVPYSMCMSSQGFIIVSDSENRALLALHQNGEKRFLFQPPKQSRVIDTPGGVACSPSGYLYLVDSCEQRILRFDRTGKFRKVVLSQEDGLEWPIGVACVDDGTLCVAEFYGQVKVFRIR